MQEVNAPLVADAKPQSEIVLVSPNGENRITLKAGDDLSGIWITHKGRTDCVAIFLEERTGAAVGVYGAMTGGNNYSGITAGVNGCPDGRVQLATDGKAKLFGAADLS